jgi:hypothetical protein
LLVRVEDLDLGAGKRLSRFVKTHVH